MLYTIITVGKKTLALEKATKHNEQCFLFSLYLFHYP